MKILVASDSFKGSLSTFDVIEMVREGACRVHSDIEVIGLPIADGGEGTLDTLFYALEGEKRVCQVMDPLGRPVDALYGVFGETAVVELSRASGYSLLRKEERNPLLATTYGTGQLISHALDDPKVKEIIVTIGGSATNDGGLGIAQALGLKALDLEGREIEKGGGALAQLAFLDGREMHPRLQEVAIRAACDVNNPLYGPMGAARVYGPQKGATPDMVEILDQNLQHLSAIIKQDLKKDISHLAGGGAAGGTGAGLVAFCGAQLEPGSQIILDLLGFEEKVKDVDLVITGEGRIDQQTAYGKAPLEVARRSKKAGKPVIGIAGALGDGIASLYREGFTAFFSLCPKPMTEEEAIKKADTYGVSAIENILRLSRFGFGFPFLCAEKDEAGSKDN